MPDPFNADRNRLPDPHRDFAGVNNSDGIGKRAFKAIAKLWTPRGTTAEEPAATVARYALRLIDRLTGRAVSADEILLRDMSNFDALAGWNAIKPSAANDLNSAPQRLYWTMNHLNWNRQNSLPPVIRTLTVGDSWATNCVSLLRAVLGTAGTVKMSSQVALNGTAVLSAHYSEYTLTPFGGRTITLSTNTSSFATFGLNGDGTGKLPVGRFAMVAYEGAAAGSFTVQYETAAGAWTALATVNCNSVATSGLQVWESAAFGPISTRIRVVWASGTPKILAAGITNLSQNNPVVATSRQGVVDCDVSIGGCTMAQMAQTTQSNWDTLLGWLKPDVIFFREKAEVDLAAWVPDFLTVITRIRTARPECDLVLIGRHLTDDGSEPRNASIDAYMRAFAADADNSATFVDIKAVMPATIQQAKNMLIHRAAPGEVHTAYYGDVLISQAVFDYFQPVRRFLHDTQGNFASGPQWYGRGVTSVPNFDFPIYFDGSLGNGTGLSFSDMGQGTVNANPVNVIWQYGTSSDWRASGLAFRRGSQDYTNINSAGQWIMGQVGLTISARQPTGRVEAHSGTAGMIALCASGITGQTANLFEMRTGASGASNGTVASRFDQTGNLKFENVGLGVSLKTGANARIGTGVALVAGVATVANTSITANTHIDITKTAHGGTGGDSYLVTKTAGASFTITAINANGATVTTDTSTFDWMLTERQ
ncbi:hypothetical protein OKA04_12310 [Luteolibacter flavescens]|uniref:K1 capsule-specific polysaccharide lyase C-terminal domain-containing protein n=1 Tax=Luteolibacter flavescens TaxID=1859460 RepID=A0ABT3FQP5_9BACT|nr:hypothetical protein [Luteolibacter flavescens]MCW1885514.1 hypothetical protein [Luteolibacter flavescens]